MSLRIEFTSLYNLKHSIMSTRRRQTTTIAPSTSIPDSPSKKTKRQSKNVIRNTAIVGLLMCLLHFVSMYTNEFSNTSISQWNHMQNKLMPIPRSKLRVACVDSAQKAVVRAFKSRKYKVLPLKGYDWEKLSECYKEGKAAVLWTKHRPPKSYWDLPQPWQRHNW